MKPDKLFNRTEDVKYSRFDRAIKEANELRGSLGDYGLWEHKSEKEKEEKEKERKIGIAKQIMKLLPVFQEALNDPDFVDNEEISSLLSSLIELSSLHKHNLDDFHKRLIAFVGTNLKQIGALISQGKEVHANCQYFYVLQSYINNSSEQDKSMAIQILEAHIPEIEAGLIKLHDQNIDYSLFLLYILKFGSEQGKLQATAVVDRVMQEGENLKVFLLKSLIEEKDLEIRALGEKHLKQILQGFDLFDPAIILKHWKVFDGRRRVYLTGSPIGENLPALINLEKECPGIAKILYEEYGIINFGRYPMELLVEQYQQRDNLDLKYGIILAPYGDKKRAFLQTVDIFRSLRQQLPEGFTIRVIETDDKSVAIERLADFSEKYGGTSFTIILGHPRGDGIDLGNNGSRGQLRASDFDLEKLKGFSRPGASFLLYSCGTGKEGGIGQEISSRLDIGLIAPESDDVVLNSITVTEQGGGR